MPEVLTYPFTDDGLKAALVALGTTASAVAANLSAGEHVGMRGSQCDCPIANYVAEVVGRAVAAEVSLDQGEAIPYVRAYIGGEYPRQYVDAMGTQALGDFIALFDHGMRYQELEASK